MNWQRPIPEKARGNASRNHVESKTNNVFIVSEAFTWSISSQDVGVL